MGSSTIVCLVTKVEVSSQLHSIGVLTTEKMPLGTDCIGGRMDPRAGLDAEKKRQILSSMEWNQGGRALDRRSTDRVIATANIITYTCKTVNITRII